MFIIVMGVVIYLVVMGLYAVLNYKDRGLLEAVVGTVGLWLVIGQWVLVLWAVMPISTGGAIGVAMVHIAIGFTLMGWAER